MKFRSLFIYKGFNTPFSGEWVFKDLNTGKWYSVYHSYNTGHTDIMELHGT